MDMHTNKIHSHAVHAWYWEKKKKKILRLNGSTGFMLRKKCKLHADLINKSSCSGTIS